METEKNWGAEPFRAPDLSEGDTLIYSECGRVLDNTCYRSHYFRLVRGQYGGYYLLVKHGGGQERTKIAYSNRIIPSLENLDSDARYFIFHTMHRIELEARTLAVENTASKYRAAFVNGKLKKRKLRGQPSVKVWIENRI